jgi:hypothetical protein
MIANSGRFKHTLPIILGLDDKNTSAFSRFMQLTEGLYKEEGSTWKISLPRLYKLLHNELVKELQLSHSTVQVRLEKDFIQSKQKGTLELLINKPKNSRKGTANKRQNNHKATP